MKFLFIIAASFIAFIIGWEAHRIYGPPVDTYKMEMHLGFVNIDDDEPVGLAYEDTHGTTRKICSEFSIPKGVEMVPCTCDIRKVQK